MGCRLVSEVILNPHSSVNPDLAFHDVFTGVGKMANRGQHWRYAEIAALLDIWGDSKIWDKLDYTYTNDSVFQKISAAFAKYVKVAQLTRNFI